MKLSLILIAFLISLTLHGSIILLSSNSKIYRPEILVKSSALSLKIINIHPEMKSVKVRPKILNENVEGKRPINLSKPPLAPSLAKLRGELKIKYPKLSRYLKEEGTVGVKVRVSKLGIPEEAYVVDSSGYERLDKEAIKKILLARFIPAKKITTNGFEKKSSFITLQIKFVLDQNTNF